METWDWQRIARAVISRRTELEIKRTRHLAERAHLSERLLGDVEHARRTRYSPATLRSIELALGWADGSIEAIGNGGAPTVVRQPSRGRASRQRRSTATDFGNLSDAELALRWRRLDVMRLEIELEYADRHGLSLNEAADRLSERSGHAHTTTVPPVAAGVEPNDPFAHELPPIGAVWRESDMDANEEEISDGAPIAAEPGTILESEREPHWPDLAQAVRKDRQSKFPRRSALVRKLELDEEALRVLEGDAQGVVTAVVVDSVTSALGWPPGRWREILRTGRHSSSRA